MRFLSLVVVCLPVFAADSLLDLAEKDPPPPELRTAIERVMKPESLRAGKAFYSEGPRFVWAVESDTPPELIVDDVSRGVMKRIDGTRLWVATAQLETGTVHSYYHWIDGKQFGGHTDFAAYLPESYEQPGVPQGRLSEQLAHTSKIYPGMTSEYWIYVPAQYDPSRPAALMVWQDGKSHTERNNYYRTLNVVDNLIHQKKIPVMILVFISPGTRGSQKMRSIQYDTVDDTYARFLRDEVLAEVQSKYNLRKDGYSRAIAGSSSGGICAFNVAWHQPDQFSRVLSRIGSFTSIKWLPGKLDGGNVYPFKIRKEPKRNIRVWLQDGSEDLENDHGSWPLQNIQMANSLKREGYDFHFSFGRGSHDSAHGNAEFPRALTWLWRDYDPAKTEQVYQQEASEQAKPFYRVAKLNRD